MVLVRPVATVVGEPGVIVGVVVAGFVFDTNPLVVFEPSSWLLLCGASITVDLFLISAASSVVLAALVDFAHIADGFFRFCPKDGHL